MKKTHKGWYWFCPTFYDLTDEENVMVEPRSFIYKPLFWAAEIVNTITNTVCSAINRNHQPVFMFLITKEIG